MEKIIQQLRNIALGLFFVLFSWLFLNVVFNNQSFSYKALPTVFSAAVWGSVLFMLGFVCHRQEAFLQKNQRKMLVAFFVIFLMVEIFFYSQAAAFPMRDLENVYMGAYQYTITGKIENPYLDYFYKFPNNMPITILLQFLFRVLYRFGFTHFLLAGAVLNFLCIAATYFFVYLCCKATLGVKWGFFAMGALLLCVPLHGYISVFYTDTITMLFPPLGFYLYLRVCKAQQGMQKALWLGGFALALGFGVTIKYSVIICVIAVLLELLLQRQGRLFVGVLLAVCCGVAAWATVFHTFMYANILDKSIARDASTPMISWVMMGAGGDGAHSAQDNYYVWANETYEARVEASVRLLRKRLAEKGFFGYLAFLNQKGVRSYGNGDLELSQTAALTPLAQTPVLECIHEDGQYRGVSKYVFQGYHVALYVFVALSAAISILKKDYRIMIPQLSVLGLYLFLLLWEAGARYLINYTPMAVLCAVFAVALIMQTPKRQLTRP